MSLTAVKMLGIKITNSSKKEILEEVQKYLDSGAKNKQKVTKKTIKPLVIATPNPEQVVFAQKNSHFRDIINRADIAIPDGVGIVWASHILASKAQKNSVSVITKTIPGIEFMEELVSFAGKRSISTALIGGRDKVALEAFDCLAKKYPGLRGFGTGLPVLHITNNELQFEDNETYFTKLMHQIVDTKTQLVFVGLGAPKQEYFIEKLVLSLRDRPASPELKRGESNGEAISQVKKIAASPSRTRDPRNDNAIVFMSVGGSFDVISSRMIRAPLWMRLIGFEWLWRLMLEPWRIKRQLALFQFIFLVLKERFSLK